MVLLDAIKNLIERVLKRTLFISEKHRHLIVIKTNAEIFESCKNFSTFVCVVWILYCLLYCVISYFQTGKISFNIVFIAYPILLIVATIFVNTSTRKINRFLRDIIEQLNLTSALNHRIRIEYTISKENTVIKFFCIISCDKADLLVREITNYFQRQYRKPFIIDEYKVLSDSFIIYFSHVKDERRSFSSINELQAPKGITPLTTKIQWDRKLQPMGLVVGPTGSGKTSVLKTIILSFLLNDNRNTLYTIDGKGSFLSVSTAHFFNENQTATSPLAAFKIVTELNELMNERYNVINEDFQDEKDQTFDEKIHSGSVLLVVDEFLALVSEMQALDKQLKPAERLYPQFYSKLLSLIVKGRSASISVIVSGQMIPASILPSEARDSLGLRIALGRISQSQAIEIFGESAKSLPSTDEEYSGLIWLDGLGWRTPKIFLSPYYNEDALPFKNTLLYFKNQRQENNREK